MDPPVCRICGKKHWSRMCDEVTKPVTTVTKTVTFKPDVTLSEGLDVTAGVTPQVVPQAPPLPPLPASREPPAETIPRLVAPSRLRALEIENEALRAEVVMLKGELAKARPAPTTSAQRMRKLRARRKEVV